MTGVLPSQPMAESSHTPTPWVADPDDREGYEWNIHILDRKGDRICFMTSDGPAEANAALIVEAVNNHARLTERCEAYKGQVEAGAARIKELEEALRTCQVALAMMTDPDAIKSTTTMHAWAHAVEAERKARALTPEAKR